MEPSQERQQDSFVNFGKAYQEKVVQAMIVDRDFAEQIIEVVDIEFFDQKYLRAISSNYFEYYKKYNAFPSKKILKSIIFGALDKDNEVILTEQIKEFFVKIKTDPLGGDEKYVKESALEFCKKQKLKNALFDCVDLIKNSKYDEVAGTIKKALELGIQKNYGHDYKNDVEKRHSEGLTRNCIPTGWEVLDKQGVLNGGLGRGELGTIIGVAGSGKSHFLVHLGAYALQHGFNVLHYTLELSDINIGIRYDACLTGVSQNDAYNLKSAIKELLPSMTNGALYIKSYPTKGASVQTLKNHIKLLESKEFKPDLIIVDYADIMKSTKGYEAKRFELENVYEELRALAQEQGVALWTVSQSNRSGSNTEIVELDNVGESWAKVQIADVVLTFSRLRKDKATKSGRVYLGKNRIGKDGMLYKAHIDTEIVNIQLFEHDENDVDEILENDRQDDEKVVKLSLRDKFEKFKLEATG